MTTTMTARDKTLLYFVALGTFLFVFVRFLFFPALEAHNNATDNLANNEVLREDMQDSLLMAPAAAQEKTTAYEDLTGNSEPYYDKLKSDALDTLVTGLELQHNLLPLTLNIGEPTAQNLTGYIASSRAGQSAGPSAATPAADAAADEAAADEAAADEAGTNIGMLASLQTDLTGVDWAASYEQAGYFSVAVVSFSASGSRSDFLALLDDLSNNYPSIQLQSFSIRDQVSANIDGEAVTTSTFTVQLNVILCDKEGVPAL